MREGDKIEFLIWQTELNIRELKRLTLEETDKTQIGDMTTDLTEILEKE